MCESLLRISWLMLWMSRVRGVVRRSSVAWLGDILVGGCRRMPCQGGLLGEG